MKRVLSLLLISSAVFLAGCASQPTSQMRFSLDSAGNLMTQEVMVPGASGCEAGAVNWCVVGAITAGVLVGVWGLDRILNDDDGKQQAAASAGPFVLPASSSGSFDMTNSYILPDFQVVN